MTGRAYLAVLLCLISAAMVPILAANLHLGSRAQGSVELTLTASRWQQESRGVTYAPPFVLNRPFKTLRLADRLPEINAVVFGASTALGITESHFPNGMRVYNFSQYGNSLATTLGEVEYASVHYSDRIKWFIVALDWSIGFLFENREPAQANLSPEDALSVLATREIPLTAQVQDAVSYPKVAALFSALSGALKAKHKTAALRQLFYSQSSDAYTCPGGVPAKDFDVLYRGKCEGFYYDGSASFSTRKRLSDPEARSHLITAGHPSSVYAASLGASKGVPNPAFLGKIAQISRSLGSVGGKIVIVLPPLLPGLEERLSVAPQTSGYLVTLKKSLSEWAAAEKIVVVDAGRSERVGCESSEFIDEHHATRECYEKILGRFWTDYRGGVAPGIYEFTK